MEWVEIGFLQDLWNDVWAVPISMKIGCVLGVLANVGIYRLLKRMGPPTSRRNTKVPDLRF